MRNETKHYFKETNIFREENKLFKGKKVKSLIASFLAISIFLVGCGQQDSEKNSEEVESSTERTLTDALGHKVTIPANPKRVIASYLEDNLVALGITPVAQWSVNDGKSIQDYLQGNLKDVPTIPHDLPVEAVMSFNPDLIIVDSATAVEGSKYEQYSKIAPTYVIRKENNNDWREELLKVGEVFGKEDKAKQVLEDYEAKAKAAKEKIHNSIGDESAAAIWLVNNQFFMVSETASSGAVLYGDLGLKTPSLVKEISNTATGDWSAVSLEKLAQLDADHIYLLNSDKGNGSDMLKDPLWKNVPAVKNNHVYEFTSDTSWLYSGAIANGQMIDDVLKTLVK